MRLANKDNNHNNVAIGILNGNNCLLAGTYKYSLGKYRVRRSATLNLVSYSFPLEDAFPNFLLDSSCWMSWLLNKVSFVAKFD